MSVVELFQATLSPRPSPFSILKLCGSSGEAQSHRGERSRELKTEKAVVSVICVLLYGVRPGEAVANGVMGEVLEAHVVGSGVHRSGHYASRSYNLLQLPSFCIA